VKFLTLPPALRYRDYRIFWSGFAVSSFGTQFTTVAMAWHIYELTDSPLQIGLLGLARGIPQMILLLFGGVIADRWNRRRVMMVTQFGQLSVSVLLAGTTVTGTATPLLLYVASTLLAVFSALEIPARQSIIPNLVPREHVTSAIAMNLTQRDVGAIVGPMLAGLALTFSGPALCYAIDGVSWMVMLAALFFISEGPHARTAVPVGALRSVAEGVSFVWRNPPILCCIMLDFAATLFGTTRSLYPIFARDILAIGPSGLGLLFSAVAVGSIIGAAFLSTLGSVRHVGRWVLIGVTIFGASIVGFSLSKTLWMTLLMLAGTGLGNVISAVMRNTIIQMSAPNELRGRVSSVNSIFASGGPLLGQFEAGTVAQFYGAPLAALSGGLATLAFALALAVVPIMRRFELPPPVAEELRVEAPT
jgi:MFS family permease